jgi:hypothetical protein
MSPTRHLEVPVEDVEPGDVLLLPHGATHVVTRISEYGDELVVWYAAQDEHRGRTFTVERRTIGRRAGERVQLAERANASWLRDAREALKLADYARRDHDLEERLLAEGIA